MSYAQQMYPTPPPVYGQAYAARPPPPPAQPQPQYGQAPAGAATDGFANITSAMSDMTIANPNTPSYPSYAQTYQPAVSAAQAPPVPARAPAPLPAQGYQAYDPSVPQQQQQQQQQQQYGASYAYRPTPVAGPEQQFAQLSQPAMGQSVQAPSPSPRPDVPVSKQAQMPTPPYSPGNTAPSFPPAPPGQPAYNQQRAYAQSPYPSLAFPPPPAPQGTYYATPPGGPGYAPPPGAPGYGGQYAQLSPAGTPLPSPGAMPTFPGQAASPAQKEGLLSKLSHMSTGKKVALGLGAVLGAAFLEHEVHEGFEKWEHSAGQHPAQHSQGSTPHRGGAHAGTNGGNTSRSIGEDGDGDGDGDGDNYDTAGDGSGNDAGWYQDQTTYNSGTVDYYEEEEGEEEVSYEQTDSWDQAAGYDTGAGQDDSYDQGADYGTGDADGNYDDGIGYGDSNDGGGNGYDQVDDYYVDESIQATGVDMQCALAVQI